jgi:hypothetical protein
MYVHTSFEESWAMLPGMQGGERGMVKKSAVGQRERTRPPARSRRQNIIDSSHCGISLYKVAVHEMSLEVVRELQYCLIVFRNGHSQESLSDAFPRISTCCCY